MHITKTKIHRPFLDLHGFSSFFPDFSRFSLTFLWNEHFIGFSRFCGNPVSIAPDVKIAFRMKQTKFNDLKLALIFTMYIPCRKRHQLLWILTHQPNNINSIYYEKQRLLSRIWQYYSNMCQYLTVK